MPLYGRCWKLREPNVNGLYAPGRKPDDAGPYTREAGFLGYNEV